MKRPFLTFHKAQLRYNGWACDAFSTNPKRTLRQYCFKKHNLASEESETHVKNALKRIK